MTRKSKREIERCLADLEKPPDRRPMLVYENPDGEWFDPQTGEVYDKDEIDPIAVIPDPIEFDSEDDVLDDLEEPP